MHFINFTPGSVECILKNENIYTPILSCSSSERCVQGGLRTSHSPGLTGFHIMKQPSLDVQLLIKGASPSHVNAAGSPDTGVSEQALNAAR